MVYYSDDGRELEQPDFIPGIDGIKSINKNRSYYNARDTSDLTIIDLIDQIIPLADFIYKVNGDHLLRPEIRIKNRDIWDKRTGFDIRRVRDYILDQYGDYFNGGYIEYDAPDILKYDHYKTDDIPDLRDLYAILLNKSDTVLMNRIKKVRAVIDEIKSAFNIEYDSFKPYSNAITIPVEIKTILNICAYGYDKADGYDESYNIADRYDESYNIADRYDEADGYDESRNKKEVTADYIDYMDSLIEREPARVFNSRRVSESKYVKAIKIYRNITARAINNIDRDSDDLNDFLDEAIQKIWEY